MPRSTEAPEAGAPAAARLPCLGTVMASLVNNSDRHPRQKVALPGHPGLWCSGLDERLAEALIARTLDPSDVRLREMTHDLSRFSSAGELAQWRPGHDLVCLQDDAGTLLGVTWIAKKAMPARDDYFDPELMRRGPRLTVAIRTYGEARGHGLAEAFVRHALERLLRDRPEGRSLWFQTKATNAAVRRLAWKMGFVEASGEEGGTVVGIRLDEREP
jgi:GNAT superfamily N-acetyltransferase